MFEKILICLDGSELAEQIVPFTMGEARCFVSQVILLQVVNLTGVVALETRETFRVISEGKKAGEKEAKQYLERMAKPFRDAGVNVECVILEGNPGPSIVKYADENKVGLIALATHGRGGLRRIVLGSVADYVLRESGLPTLLIKPRGFLTRAT